MRHLALLAILTLACSDRDAVRIAELEQQVIQLRGDLASAKLDQPACPAAVALPAPTSIEACGTDDAALRAEVARVETENARLTAALAAAQGEAERYKAGLGRAVTALNTTAAAAPAPRETADPQGDLSALYTRASYRITETNETWSRFAWVVEIQNSKAQTQRVKVLVTFEDRSGFQVGEDRETVTVPIGSTTVTGYQLIRHPAAESVSRVRAQITH